MKKYILIGTSGKASMLLALSKMDCPDVILLQKTASGRIKSYSHPYKVSTFTTMPKFDKDIVLRWGNSIQINTTLDTKVVNKVGAVAKASNKKTFRFLALNTEIPTPELITRPEVYGDKGVSWPVITRPERHHAGNSFFISYSQRELDRAVGLLGRSTSYTSKFYNKQREVRVHCAFGKVLVIKEKPQPKNIHEIAWNFSLNEEAWSTIDRKDYDVNICRIALQAMDLCELDIGAVDIMFDPIDKTLPPYVVCEINTSPSLTEYLAEKYAYLFKQIFTTGIPEKWDYSKFKKGESFSWKNFQLGKNQ